MTRDIKERPMLFSAPMVRALLDGSKTQTRRIMKPQPQPAPEPGKHWWPSNPHQSMLRVEDEMQKWTGLAGDCCPYGDHGDRLWVRETHRPIFGQTCGLIGVDYQADPREKWERLGDAPDCLIKSKWTPSIHMRREYSRILLEVVSVRVERLQDISEADAKAEGIEPHEVRQFAIYGMSAAERAAVYRDAAVGPYRGLWQQINGADSWDANPWVWVVEFKRLIPIS